MKILIKHEETEMLFVKFYARKKKKNYLINIYLN